MREQDIIRIQERFFDPEEPPIDVSDMSLLIASLANTTAATLTKDVNVELRVQSAMSYI